MSNILPLNIEMGALPPNVAWTPQQLGDAIAERLRITTQQTFSLFVSGSTEPSSNVGPWLKNGNEWYVWSDSLGAYEPITIPSASLGYWIGPDAPDPAVYNFWIETAPGGSPISLNIYFSGAWVNVDSTDLSAYLTIAVAAATYQTIAGMSAYLTTAAAATTYAPLASPALIGTPTVPTAAPGTNTTQASSTAFVTAAIAAIPAPGAFQAYPAQGTNAGAQSITPNGTPVKATMGTASINPAPAPFNTGSSRYVAPADGVYGFTISTQLDNNGAAAATMEISCDLYKNGSSSGIGDLDGTPSPNGSRWSPGVSGIISLVTNDYLEVYIDAADGVGAGSVDLNKVFLSVWRISA